MLQVGIRLHDVNTGLAKEALTLKARAAKAREEGFGSVHLAFSKVFKDMPTDPSTVCEGLAAYTARVLGSEGLDTAVLGCYLNLAHPDPEKLKEIQANYFAHIRAGALLRASVVGTETGAPNEQYRFDADTHTKEALGIFLKGLEPVVECAEKYGVSLAIEPVWKHIVYDADRAREVLDAIKSPNLRIILDPVNLLYKGNLSERDRVIGRAMDLLAESIAVIHLKDYRIGETDIVSIAAGTGEMDYTGIMKFIKARKPYIQATLENTDNDNAVAARELIERAYDEA